MARPPLELAVEVEAANGRRTRWDGNTRSAGDIPTGISFSTKRGDGFSDGPNITLQRRIDRDYPDINLYDDLRLIGADGSVAYEGYISADPRTFSGGHTVSVRVAGPMTLAQLRPFSEVYIDRDLSKWGDPSNARQAALLGANFSPVGPTVQTDPATGSSSVSTQFTGAWTAVSIPISEALYLAPPGVHLGRLYYDVKAGPNVDTADANWSWSAALATDDTVSSVDGSGNLRSGSEETGTVTATTTSRGVANLQATYGSGPAGGDNVLFPIYWRNLAPMGTHGLTLQASTTAGPGGLYVSDMIRNICDRFTNLDSTGVQSTTYPVDSAVFTQVQPYDAWLTLNTYHLWELAVWENKVLHYYPADTTQYDWQIRLDDPGVTVDLPGDSTEQLANGIVVSYQDIQTGTTMLLTPDDTPALSDPNPLNPATLHGLTSWTTVDLTQIPLSAADATQIGTAALAEFNQPKATGTITFQGHIRDRAGNWQPGWKVRASDTIAIINHPDDRPRLIGETQWDQDSLTCTVAVDNTLNRVDAFLDRSATALQAANLSFPS